MVQDSAMLSRTFLTCFAGMTAPGPFALTAQALNT